MSETPAQSFSKFKFLYGQLKEDLPMRLERCTRRVFKTRLNKSEKEMFEKEHELIFGALKKQRDMGIGVGSLVPDFKLMNCQGQEERLLDLLGKRVVILMFRSGKWSEWDKEEIQAYMELRHRIQKLGGVIVVICPQPKAMLNMWADELDLNPADPDIRLVTDKQNEYAQQFGMVYQPTFEMIRLFQMVGWAYGQENGTWDLSCPMTMVIGKDQRIKWMDIQYSLKTRCHPETLLQQLNKLKKIVIKL